MGEKEYLYVISSLWVVVLAFGGVILYFIRKTLSSILGTLKEHTTELNQLNMTRAQAAANDEVVNHLMQTVQKKLVEFEEDMKLLRRIEANISNFSVHILAIPEMRKDIDAYHGLIRSNKEAFLQHKETTEKVDKMLRARTHFIVNKLQTIRMKMEQKGFDFNAESWQMPDIEDTY